MGLSNRKLRQIALPILGLCLLTLFYLNGKRVGSPFLDADFANSTYLSDTSYFGTSPMLRHYAYLFGMSNFASQAAFENLYSDYERKSNYGLLNSNGQRVFQEQFDSLAKNGLMDFERRRMNIAGRDIASSANFADVRTPAAAMAMMAAAYTGRLIEYRAAPDLRIRSQTQRQDSRLDHQYLGMETKNFGGSMDYMSERDSGHSGGDYKAGISGRLASMGTGAGTAYSVRSQTITTTVSQKLSEKVSVSYDRVDSNVNRPGHTVGIGFTSGF